MYIIFRWIINALALLGVAYLLPGVDVGTFYNAMIAALALGLVNALIRPILLILTLPVNIITLGLFTFVINALLIWLVSTMIQGFVVAGFIPALQAALLLWLVSVVTSWLISQAKES
jgi:putative membrane protein